MAFATTVVLAALWGGDADRPAPAVRAVVVPALLPPGTPTAFAQRLLGAPLLYDGFGRPGAALETLWYPGYDFQLQFVNGRLRAIEPWDNERGRR